MILFATAQAGDPELVFEAVPDYNVANVNVRLCAIRLLDIGEGLPCLYHTERQIQPTFNKSSDTVLFDDGGELSIGQTCPVNYENGDTNANSFVAQVIYELPVQEALPDATCKFNF